MPFFQHRLDHGPLHQEARGKTTLQQDPNGLVELLNGVGRQLHQWVSFW